MNQISTDVRPTRLTDSPRQVAAEEASHHRDHSPQGARLAGFVESEPLTATQINYAR